MLAARKVCVLDAPQAKVEDPELADALQKKGQRIIQTTVVLSIVLTVIFYFVP